MGNLNLEALYAQDRQGYSLAQAIYTAMSMDMEYWKALISLQAGSGSRLTDPELILELKKTTFFVQGITGSIPVDLSSHKEVYAMLSKHTYLYKSSSPCFHAKLAILRYTCEGKPDYYRIAVMSKNLTYDSDYQNIVIFDGEASSKKVTGNGQKLWNYLDYCKNNCNKSLFNFCKEKIPSHEAVSQNNE